MNTSEAKLTKNQALVFTMLSKAQGPMSAYAILDSLRDDGLRAPPQVYRALDKLVASGLVHRLESLNAFVACSHSQCHTSGLIAFAICEQCGLVSEFSDDTVTQGLNAWISDHAFTNTKTTIEIRGDCESCSVH